jgi:hypothetical protein
VSLVGVDGVRAVASAGRDRKAPMTGGDDDVVVVRCGGEQAIVELASRW